MRRLVWDAPGVGQLPPYLPRPPTSTPVLPLCNLPPGPQEAPNYPAMARYSCLLILLLALACQAAGQRRRRSQAPEPTPTGGCALWSSLSVGFGPEERPTRGLGTASRRSRWQLHKPCAWLVWPTVHNWTTDRDQSACLCPGTHQPGTLLDPPFLLQLRTLNLSAGSPRPATAQTLASAGAPPPAQPPAHRRRPSPAAEQPRWHVLPPQRGIPVLCSCALSAARAHHWVVVSPPPPQRCTQLRRRLLPAPCCRNVDVDGRVGCWQHLLYTNNDPTWFCYVRTELRHAPVPQPTTACDLTSSCLAG